MYSHIRAVTGLTTIWHVLQCDCNCCNSVDWALIVAIVCLLCMIMQYVDSQLIRWLNGSTSMIMHMLCIFHIVICWARIGRWACVFVGFSCYVALNAVALPDCCNTCACVHFLCAAAVTHNDHHFLYIYVRRLPCQQLVQPMHYPDCTQSTADTVTDNTPSFHSFSVKVIIRCLCCVLPDPNPCHVHAHITIWHDIFAHLQPSFPARRVKTAGSPSPSS